MRLLTQKKLRSAFTLIELITVMAIILVIAALGIGAAAKGLGWVKQRSTEATMTKVLERVGHRLDQIFKEAKNWPTETENIIQSQAGGSPQRAYVLKVLYLYKWSFPNCYAEAFHNVQESRQLYDTANGYPPAVGILQKLRRGTSGPAAIPDPMQLPSTAFWTAGTPTPAQTAIPQIIPSQSAACLLVSYETAGGSRDEFAPTELGKTAFDQNNMLIDGWGNPLLCLRNGNFMFSRHRVGNGNVDRPAWWMGMVNTSGLNDLDFAPLELILNPAGAAPRYYYDQLQVRAATAYPNLLGRDPFDPNTVLKQNGPWRTDTVSGFYYQLGGWLNPNPPVPPYAPWLPITGGGTNQNILFFASTFGYSPDPAATTDAFTPMLILSSGGDKLFTTWDDNLDSYRLKVNLSGTQ
jgi:prepilin-type N-terminal cleavage/methylation domain-containing protein